MVCSPRREALLVPASQKMAQGIYGCPKYIHVFVLYSLFYQGRSVSVGIFSELIYTVYNPSSTHNSSLQKALKIVFFMSLQKTHWTVKLVMNGKSLVSFNINILKSYCQNINAFDYRAYTRPLRAIT